MAGHLKSENTPNKKKMMKRKPMMYGGRTMMKKGGSKNVNDRIMYAGGGDVLKPN
jgi:hypothetical protein